MASVAARVVGWEILQGPHDAFAGETTTRVKRAILYIDHNGVQVAGGTDTLDVVPATEIATLLRNGKTITMRGTPTLAQPCRSSADVSYAGTTALSSTTVQLTPKTTDWSTNATILATVTLTRPYGLFVEFSEA